MASAQPFGIDFGGTGIKGAPVDLETGDFAAERERIRTPEKSTPEAIAEIFVDLLDKFPDCTGAVGVTVPGVVRHGVVHSAANIDKSLDRHRRRRALHRGDRPRRPRRQRRRRRRPRRGAVRRGAGPHRAGHRHHARHRHRLGAGQRRRARAQLRARPPRDRRPRRRVTGGQQRAHPRGPVAGSTGRAAHDVLPDPREALLPRPVRGRRRRQQGRPTSSCRCSTSTPRSSRPSCATRPASSAPRSTRTRGRRLSPARRPLGSAAASSTLDHSVEVARDERPLRPASNSASRSGQRVEGHRRSRARSIARTRLSVMRTGDPAPVGVVRRGARRARAAPVGRRPRSRPPWRPSRRRASSAGPERLAARCSRATSSVSLRPARRATTRPQPCRRACDDGAHGHQARRRTHGPPRRLASTRHVR